MKKIENQDTTEDMITAQEDTGMKGIETHQEKVIEQEICTLYI